MQSSALPEATERKKKGTKLAQKNTEGLMRLIRFGFYLIASR